MFSLLKNKAIMDSETNPAIAANAHIGRGLRCLAAISEWERKHLPFIKSTSGRDLYFLIVKHFLLPDKVAPLIPLKSFTFDLTDKAMRQRMHEFEKLGLLAIEVSAEDGRSKTIRPTARLHRLFISHTLATRECFSHHFHFVKKDKGNPLMLPHSSGAQPSSMV